MRSMIRLVVLALGLPLMAGAGLPQHPIDINTATATELMQLPGVGAKTAERIVLFRKQHGAFRKVEEVMNVKGIGEKSFAKLRPHLALGGASQPKAAGGPAPSR